MVKDLYSASVMSGKVKRIYDTSSLGSHEIKRDLANGLYCRLNWSAVVLDVG